MSEGLCVAEAVGVEPTLPKGSTKAFCQHTHTFQTQVAHTYYVIKKHSMRPPVLWYRSTSTWVSDGSQPTQTHMCASSI